MFLANSPVEVRPPALRRAALARRLAFCLPLIVVWGTGTRADETSTRWHTGVQFEKSLAAPTGITWPENPLRSALYSLARNQQVAVWLDRRIDPDQLVTFTVQNAPLEELLLRLAAHLRGGLSLTGPVAYVGPPATAARLATLAELRREEIRRLAGTTGNRLLRLRATQWDELSTPHELVEQAAREYEIRFVNLEMLPHDLWPAGELPAMGFAERMTLLLAGFDLTFEVSPDGTAARLLPMPETVSLVKTYDVGGKVNAAEKINELFPDARLQKQANRLEVAAVAETHRQISRLLNGQTVRRIAAAGAGGGKQTYTLKVENNRVGNVIKALAPRLMLTVKYERSVGGLLDKPVTFNVEKVSRDELLTAVLKPAGLAFRLEDETLTIFAAGQ